MHDVYCYPTCLTGELRQLYTLTPIAVIGGSFLPGLSGHNISEAAAAGCAILTGACCNLFCPSSS
jgi:3-deoxy-D-manno-octulosonic-acid transferase